MADNIYGPFCRWYPPIMGGVDNVQLDKNTTTGAIIAADAVVVGTTTQYHQRVKISIGTSGSASDVHSGNRLPVITTTGSLIAVRATGTSLAVKVSGSITIVEPITISGAVKVSGVVTVSPTGNFYVITPTGTSLPVRVSGTVAIAEPVTISGNIKVSGNVAYLDYAWATGTTQTRLAFGIIVPASGGAVIAGGTGRSLRVAPSGTAFPVKVSGSVTIVEPITISGAVKVSGTVTTKVSGTVALVEPITISGNVGVSGMRADRASFTKGTSKIIPIGGYFGTGGLTASGQTGIIRTTSRGIMLVTHSATPAVKVSGTVAIAEPITISGSITSITNTVVTKVSGTVTIAEPVTISGVVKVSGNVNIAEPITISGSITSITNAVSVTGGPVKVVGAAANDAAVAGNPVLIANRARLTISGISVTTGDVVYRMADLQGRGVIILNAPPAVVATGTRGPITANVTTTQATVLNAPGANQFIVISSAQVSNNGGSSRRIGLSEGTTVRWRGRVFASGGGWGSNFHPPWKLPANTAFAVTSTTAPNVDVSVQFHVERT